MINHLPLKLLKTNIDVGFHQMEDYLFLFGSLAEIILQKLSLPLRVEFLFPFLDWRQHLNVFSDELL